jgi:CxxC motif-containing protein (DUF1111 family)
MTKSYVAYRWSVTRIAAVMLGTTALSVPVLAQDANFKLLAQNTGAASTANTASTANNNNRRPPTGPGQPGGPGQSSQATDPGLRGGAPGAGGPLAGLSQDQLNFFTAAQGVFNNVDAVPFPGGLGPVFNFNSCGGCHAQPAAGGVGPLPNPQIAVATLMGATNTIPSFITLNGPVREARFIRNPDGTPDGGVHDLFTIAGRSDAPNCHLAQPDFAAAIAANNIIFRIPTPVFGAGLVENVPDAGLQASVANLAHLRSSLGISGHFNTSGNDGTITRFGWKAQNKSLLIFAGEAYNVEMGVTNELFPNERNTTAGCAFNPTPEDTTNFTDTTNSASASSDFSSDVINFAMFMRLLAPPTPATPGATPTASSTSTSTPATSTASSTSTSTTATPAATTTASSTSTTTTGQSASPTSVQVASAGTDSVLSAVSGSAAPSTSSSSATSAASVTRGQQVFTNIGCQACHIPSQTTAQSSFVSAQSNVAFSPFSDFAVHSMGVGLADNVTQGNATGSQFRSAPLWGIGQRIFFLHDGRTNDLKVAIEQHASSGSEANQVIQNFNMLGTTDQQSLLNFLRSL